MIRFFLRTCAIVILAVLTNSGVAEEVLFEDTFDGQMSPKWQVIGLTKEDYRVRDGALEFRVQPGDETRIPPMLMVTLPFQTTESVTASVELTLLDRLTKRGESAGLFLTDADSPEFAAKITNINGHLVYSPGEVEFVGKPGTEGDPYQYALKFWPARDENGPLKIIVRGNYAYFQVGPSQTGKYLNFLHSAVRPDKPKRGFCLSAYGAPDDSDHWVRFDNFRVVR